MNRISGLAPTAALLALSLLASFAPAAFAGEPGGARELLLSGDYFSEFYGVDAADVLTFDASNRSLALPFASNRSVGRSCLDAPLKLDCSKFSAFELAFSIDDERAIGFATLYFHSPGGWYGCSSPKKRVADGTVYYIFDAGSFGTEDNPAGFDKVDGVRIAFWRGLDVDAKVTFRSFKAARLNFAVIAVDDAGRENETYVKTFTRLANRTGLYAERLDGSKVTAEELRRFSVVFLPIAGNISREAVDALCEYVDQGGFLVACYNVPDKLLRRMGIKTTGFVSCKDAGIELSGMSFDGALARQAKERGFNLPETVEQKSWNFYKVEPDPAWNAKKTSAIWGGTQARVLANWALEGGAVSEYPALIASPNGLYCSHILNESGLDAKKALLESFVLAVAPEVSRTLARGEWTSIFSVGLEPGADEQKYRSETLDLLEKGLAERGFSLDDAVEFTGASKEPVDAVKIAAFRAAVAELKRARVDEYCASRPSRENEGRLWWEHSGCGIYPGDWDRTMKELSEAGFNGVIPNMLWGGNAYYESDVLPVDAKVARYGDQIAQAVAAGKKYGVDVHAWMVCFNASNSTKEFLDQMRSEGRLQKTVNGEEKPWLCPSHPKNRALQLAALEEVATKYDVAGVHFDYIRFPDDSTCYCDGCKERFAKAYKEKTGEDLPGVFPDCVREAGPVRDAWRQWRCDQITALVRAVHDSLKAKRPDIKLSAAVFTGYPGTKNSIGQDWGLWIDEGLLDFVCPMDYTSDPASFVNYIKRQLPYTEGKIPLYPGIGMTATGISMSAEEVVMQADLTRKLGAQGFTIFNLTKSTADKALPALKMGVTAKPAKAPHVK